MPVSEKIFVWLSKDSVTALDREVEKRVRESPMNRTLRPGGWHGKLLRDDQRLQRVVPSVDPTSASTSARVPLFISLGILA